MTRYIDPNSGAAPQPGGFAVTMPQAKARTTTEPDEARELPSEEQGEVNEHDAVGQVQDAAEGQTPDGAEQQGQPEPDGAEQSEQSEGGESEQSESEGGDPEPDGAEQPEEGEKSEGEKPEAPAGNASTEAWRAYAVETGQVTAEEAENYSRAELRELLD